MNKVPRRATGAVTGLLLAAAAATAAPAGAATDDRHTHGDAGPAFRHLGSFSVPANLAAGIHPATPTSAEIVDVLRGGKTVVYTDSLQRRVGFVDISDPTAPRPLGAIDPGGEPTSIATRGPFELVAVNTSPSFMAPSGDLVVLDARNRSIVRRIPLAGQPDSIAISPDGAYAAIVIENERDEDVDGGLIPQAPAGTLQVVSIKGDPKGWKVRTVDLTGLSTIAPDDPEPEFVDINTKNQVVVSLQENNWLAIVDLPRAKVTRSFSAGATDLSGIDATEEELGPQGQGLINLTDSLTNRRREPDAVGWVDDKTFATANEGDYEDADGVEGGSRGFTLFKSDGSVVYESGASFEHEVVRAGQFPHARAANKGVEPEGIEVARVDGRTLLFIAAERANVVGVYDVTHPSKPRFRQLLPTGIGPEGLRYVPERGLLVVSAETDGAADGFAVRPLMTVYGLDGTKPGYPMLQSADDAAGLPIPWTAISGLAGDPQDDRTMWAVSDSYLAQAFLYRIALGRHGTGLITQRIPVGGVDVDDTLGDFDLEGVAARPEGGFWVASEGRVDPETGRPNLLVRVAPDGTVLQSVALPPALVAGATSSGFEGVAVRGTEAGGDETLYAPIQREWADDPQGFVKLARYEVATGTWTFARYPLDAPQSPSGGWVGLSELTLLPDGHTAALIERDDRIAGDARIKKITGVDLDRVDWRALDDPRGLQVVRKTPLRNTLRDLSRRSISVPDKLEGLGITKHGDVFLATDNDGTDENYGETLFFSPGPSWYALHP